MRKELTLKVIIFWLTVGLLIGALVGGYTMAAVMGSYIIKHNLNQTETVLTQTK